MARTKLEIRVINQIIKAHGAKLDLAKDPGVLIEIVRKYGPDLGVIALTPDGGVGSLPGGVPHPPPPAPDGGVGPTGPTSHHIGPNLDDVMREVLNLKREVAKLNRTR